MLVNKIILGVTIAAASMGVAASSTASAQSTYRQRHSIRARQANEQRRIDQGVRSGQITPRGAAIAERNQSRISNEEHQMRAVDGGRLTPQDRHTLARQQNQASQGIYNRKHNGYTDPGVVPNYPR